MTGDKRLFEQVHAKLLFSTVFALAATAAGATAVVNSMLPALIAGALLFLLALSLDATRTSAVCLSSVLILGSLEPPRIAGITVINIALAACFCALILHHILDKKVEKKINPPIWILLFLTAGLLSVSNLKNLSAFSTPLLAAAVTFVIIRRGKGHQALAALAIAGLSHAFIGLYESSTHSSVAYTGWKDAIAADVGGIRRAASFIGDPNYLALTLLCCAPGLVYVSRKLSKVRQFILWVPFTLAILLTFSRGVLLGACVSLLFFLVGKYSLLRKPIQLFGGLLFLLAGLGAFLTTPIGQSLLRRFSTLDASTRSRSALQSAAFELFQNNWLTGVGIGNLGQYLSPLANALVPLNALGVKAFLPQTDPLNTYLLVGAEGGIFALVLVVGVLVAAYTLSVRRKPDMAAVILGVAVVAATLDLVQSPVVWCFFVLAIKWRGFEAMNASDPPLNLHSMTSRSLALRRTRLSRATSMPGDESQQIESDTKRLRRLGTSALKSRDHNVSLPSWK